MKLRRSSFGFAIAAVALVLGGCSDGGDPVALYLPTEQPDTLAENATVRSGDFVIRYVYEGRTARSEVVPVEVPVGMRFEAAVAQGAVVEKGQRVGRLTIVKSTERQLTAGADDSTVDASRLAALEERVGPVKAPTSGVFRLSDGQPALTSSGTDVAVELNPLQVLRSQLVELDGTAEVETIYGFRSVPCQGVWVENSPGDSAEQSVLRCRLAADVETAVGLPAKVTLTASRNDVLSVPSVYVGYDADSESFIVHRQAGGETEQVPVVTGATDGVKRMILSGVDEGDLLVAPPRSVGFSQ